MDEVGQGGGSKNSVFVKTSFVSGGIFNLYNFHISLFECCRPTLNLYFSKKPPC